MFDYGIETFGPAQAERSMAEVLQTLTTLATFQELARERREASAPVRVHDHGRHYIAYTIGDEHISIVRIFRREADLDALLKGLS